MENQKLSPFSLLIENSWNLYKTNWKKITLLFLPVEILVLMSVFVIDITPQTGSFWLTLLAILFTLVAFLAKSFSKLLSIDAPLFVSTIYKGEHTPLLGIWYKNLLRKIVPLASILIFVFFLNFAFVTLLTLLGIVVFTLTAVFFRDFDPTSPLVILSFVITLLAVYLILRTSIKFLVSGLFSTYVYVFEERKGLDAVATSFMLTKGKQFKLFWRLFGIWLISVIPFMLLVWPINGKIIFDNIESIYTQAFVLHIEPVIPDVSLLLTLLRDFFGSIAALFSLGFVAVAHYFLWKNLKERAVPFDGVAYAKTRNLIKHGVGIGIFLFAVIFFASLFFGFLAIPR